MNAPLAHLHKEPAPAPTWIRLFMAAVEDESLDLAAEPSRRASLVAAELVPATKSDERPTWVRRFAALLDREPLRLYELERVASPLAPIETMDDRIIEGVRRAVRGY